VGEQAVRVFCSHRRVDKPAVEAFATRLRADGIEAWRWQKGWRAVGVRAFHATRQHRRRDT
jgi:hypothetical protein